MDINTNISISPEAMYRIGVKAVELILRRTAKGLDINDQPFKPYSTRPFKMPWSALRLSKGVIKSLVKQNKARIVKDGVIFLGGYAEFKKETKKGNTSVNLMLTAQMLNGLTVIDTKPNKVTLGWTVAELGERAYYNKLRGREFLGLSPKDLMNETLQKVIKDAVSI